MKKIYGFMMAVLVLGAGFYACDTGALDGIPGNEAKTGDITYSVSADGASGTASSTAIAFAFSGAVEGLSADDITVAAGTGAVAKGTLSGNGASWSLGVSVTVAGDITVTITKPGIESGPKTVVVHKAGETTPGPVTYSASANGTMGTANSTAIAFAFAEAVTGLVAEEISVTADTGSVTKGTLTGDGTGWSLGITVATAGNVKVAINKSGIENTVKDVIVHKAGVTLVAVTGVSLNTDSLILGLEDSADLTATVEPAEAANKAVTWLSSDTNVATVDANGTVTSVAAGSATITVTTADGGKTATCDVTVDSSIVKVTGVSIGTAALQTDGTGRWIKEGESAALTVAVEPGNATSTAVQWTSSDTSIATVDEDGKITGVAAGSVTITVTTVSGGKTDTCAVTVKPKVTGVVLDQTRLVLGTGATADLTATVSPAHAPDKSVTWESSDTEVATVDANGTVSSVKGGTATITVTTNDGGKTATCTVDVPLTFTISSSTEWSAAVTTISEADSGSEGSPAVFVLNITADFNALGNKFILGDYKEVWLTGDRTITLDPSSSGNLIWAATLQTLIIDGPTLRGKADNTDALVSVSGYNNKATLEFRSGHITGNSNSSYSYGSKSYTGGGVYVGDNGIFIMTGGTISGNTVTYTADYSSCAGGGVYVGGQNSPSFTMKGGTISGNTAIYIGSNGRSYGGGVYVQKNAAFTMEGGTITKNTADSGGGVNFGGGNYPSGSGDPTFIMKGGTISENTAEIGGGVYSEHGPFTMESGTITKNAAGYGGGGVSSMGIFTMKGGTISENTAGCEEWGGTGGGVDVYGPFTMEGGFITNNTALSGNGGDYSTSYGGGLYVYYFGNNNGENIPLMKGGTVSGNTADNGGGVFVNTGGNFTMENGSITNNTASESGGGVYVSDGTSCSFTMTGGTISGNIATKSDNGVYAGVGYGSNFTQEGGNCQTN
jgi:uncharacterized protein YjdB